MASTSSKQVNRQLGYKVPELEALAQCYMDVSQDGDVGPDQDGDVFWQRVQEKHSAMGFTRSHGGLKAQWRNVGKELAYFSSIMRRYAIEKKKGGRSGTVWEDDYKEALKDYRSERKKKFDKLETSWKIVRVMPKFSDDPHTFAGFEASADADFLSRANSRILRGLSSSAKKRKKENIIQGNSDGSKRGKTKQQDLDKILSAVQSMVPAKADPNAETLTSLAAYLQTMEAVWKTNPEAYPNKDDIRASVLQKMTVKLSGGVVSATSSVTNFTPKPVSRLDFNEGERTQPVKAKPSVVAVKEPRSQHKKKGKKKKLIEEDSTEEDESSPDLSDNESAGEVSEEEKPEEREQEEEEDQFFDPAAPPQRDSYEDLKERFPQFDDFDDEVLLSRRVGDPEDGEGARMEMTDREWACYKKAFPRDALWEKKMIEDAETLKEGIKPILNPTDEQIMLGLAPMTEDFRRRVPALAKQVEEKEKPKEKEAEVPFGTHAPDPEPKPKKSVKKPPSPTKSVASKASASGSRHSKRLEKGPQPQSDVEKRYKKALEDLIFARDANRSTWVMKNALLRLNEVEGELGFNKTTENDIAKLTI